MQLSDDKGPRSRCSRQLKRNHRHSRHHFQNPTNPGSYPANSSLTNPGTTKNRLRKFRGVKVQTLKNIKQNYKFFFFTFSTLHLCTLQIFTIYFGYSGSIDSKNSHDLPPPLAPSKQCAYHVARLLNFAIRSLLSSSPAVDVYMNLPALSLEHGWLAQ